MLLRPRMQTAAAMQSEQSDKGMVFVQIDLRSFRTTQQDESD